MRLSLFTPRRAGRFRKRSVWFVLFCEGKQGLERMYSWGNRGYPSNYEGEASFFFQSVGKSGGCEAKGLFRLEYLHAEGQEVSGEHRFGMFAGCGGKGKYAKEIFTCRRAGGFRRRSVRSVRKDRRKRRFRARCRWQVQAPKTFFFFLFASI